VITASTPLLLAALGELVTERAGVLNLGVEGMMLMGAVVGFAVTLTTGNWMVGVLAAALAGAGLALVGNIPTTDNARVFYQNGTAEERRFGRSNVLTDGGTPPFPQGLKLVKDAGSDTLSTANLNAGLGTPGVGIAGFPNPYAFLYPETWAACNESLPYYQGRYFIIFKQAATTVDKDGKIHDNVPEGCAPVRLLPECTPLNDLPAGSSSSHEFAIEDRCYKDVKSIKWSEYGP